uniref:JmjC domain-containing protein n=1 Tax=Micromonas pusilla TaxID=38833 RepID=A0A7S0PV71_MICPS
MGARNKLMERGTARLEEIEEVNDRRIGAKFLLDIVTSHPTWTERKIDVMTAEDSNVFIGDIRVHQPSEISTDALVERVNRRRSRYVWSIFLSQSPAWTSGRGEGPNLPVVEALFDPIVGKCVGSDSSSLTYGEVAPCFGDGATSPVLNVDPSTPMRSINLWYSPDSSRSSLHFDDYHNVLCVVAGEKTVRLWKPGKFLDFYVDNPLGESANHSGIDVTCTVYEPEADPKDLFPEFFDHEGTGTQIPPDETRVLRAGDCLFVPEGWWHWVDSSSGAMAVNFWWESPFAADLAARVEPLLSWNVFDENESSEESKESNESNESKESADSLNERFDGLMRELAADLASESSEYRRRKIFAACGRIEKHRLVTNLIHSEGARQFRGRRGLSNTKWGRAELGENFERNFPFYERFADRLCYDVKKITFGNGYDPRDFEKRWPDPARDGVPHHARKEEHHDDVFKIGVDVLSWMAYSTPRELWDFLKYLASEPYYLGEDCDDELVASKQNTVRLLLLVFIANNDRACELLTYKLELCEVGKDEDEVKRFYGLVYGVLSHEEKESFTAGLLRRKDQFSWKFSKHVAYNVLDMEDLAAVLGRNVAGRGCTSEGMAPHSAHLAQLFDPAQLDSTAWLEVATNRLDVAWTKHWETQPEHVDPPVLTEEQVLDMLAELDKREKMEERMRAIKDRRAEEMTYEN